MNKREYNLQYRRNKRKERRSIALEMLGGKCVNCGTTDQLEFDHIDRETKQYNISAIYHYTLEVFINEVNKCQLLCKGCHIEKNIREQIGRKPITENQHGTHNSYQVDGCRCHICTKFNSEYRKQYYKKNGWYKRQTDKPLSSQHGTTYHYVKYKCRCDVCVEGHRKNLKNQYERDKQKRLLNKS